MHQQAEISFEIIAVSGAKRSRKKKGIVNERLAE